MKIIDKTPFYNNETGKISIIDRTRALVKYGRAWISEMDAQRSVLPVFEKFLDNKFTLLRNIPLPGMDAPISFILIGPPGIYVIFVTDMIGMYRAKGDEWSLLIDNTLKPEKTNLLHHTNLLARSVQVFLERHGFKDIDEVVGILLCVNPSMYVDSQRPIVRIIMRDALERFTVSLSQSDALLPLDKIYRIIDLITAQASAEEEKSSETVDSTPEVATDKLSEKTPSPVHADISPEGEIPQMAENEFPAFLNELIHSGGEQGEEKLQEIQKSFTSFTQEKQVSDTAGKFFPEEAEWQFEKPVDEIGFSSPQLIPLHTEDTMDSGKAPLPESLFPTPIDQPASTETTRLEAQKKVVKKGFSRNQWFILIVMAVIWLSLVFAFLYILLKDLFL